MRFQTLNPNGMPCRALSARFLRAGLPMVFLFSLFFIGNAWAYTFQSTGLYRSYNELASWANDLQTQNPDLVKVVQYGTSYQGRPLLAIEISANVGIDDPSKPEFLFSGGIHAREVISSEAALVIAENLVSGYTSADPAVRASYQSMLSQRDVWIIPQQNPDGRMAVEAGRSDQRKNLHYFPGQTQNTYTVGVDLNRNYPHLWNLASSYVADETYRGPAPLSEPESNSLWNLLHDETKFSSLLASIDFHSGAQTILTPWSSPTDYRNNQGQIPQDVQNKFTALAAEMSAMTGFSTSRLGYDYYGTFSDSLYEEFHSYSMTVELFNGPMFGVYPDTYFSLFNPISEASRDAVIQKAVASALYLLSNEAFAVPEPSTIVLLVFAGFALMALRRRFRW